MTRPLLEVRELRKTFRLNSSRPGAPRQVVRAVDGVSFALQPGEILGLVGESGCGKSTIAKLVLRLLDADGGSVRFEGQELVGLPSRQLTPFIIHGLANRHTARDQVVELLRTVGLDAEHVDRYPHEFSGGQRQRIGIARALAVRPRLVIADEPVSALDLSIQAQIVNLLQDLQEQFGLTYLFISHDLGIVEHLCNRVAVMYLGRIVELAPAGALYAAPRHPYSEALLNAVPVPDPNRATKRLILGGEIPSAANPPSGCHFHPRCPYARELCRTTYPPLHEQLPGHFAACHFSDAVGALRR